MKRLWRAMAAIDPRRNPALAAELSMAWRRALHSWLARSFAALIVLHAIYGVWIWRNQLFMGDGSISIQVGTFDLPLGLYTPYDVQFYFFHLCLYLGPLFFAMPDWTRRKREGQFEELVVSSLSRSDLLWAFVIPWFLRIFAIIYLLYLAMLPWYNWWLFRFSDSCYDMSGFLKQYWTSWHFYITLQYFMTMLLFNLISVGLASLLVRSQTKRVLLYLALTVTLDFVAYTICAAVYVYPGSSGGNAEGLIAWLSACIPANFFLNFFLLMFHAWAWFAVLFYPLKWALMAWLIRAIARRIPAERWIR